MDLSYSELIHYRGLIRYKKSYRSYKVILLSLLTVLIAIPSTENSLWYKHKKSTLEELTTVIAERNGLSPKLVHSIIQVESSWQPYALSSKGAIGLMQVHYPTWKERWSRKQLRDPEENLKAGMWILKKYMRESSTLNEALHKYSGGAKGYADKVKRRMKG